MTLEQLPVVVPQTAAAVVWTVQRRIFLTTVTAMAVCRNSHTNGLVAVTVSHHPVPGKPSMETSVFHILRSTTTMAD